MTRARHPSVLAGLLVLAFAGQALACSPELIDSALDEADGQLAQALNAASLDAARAHLRRVAFVMGEAEVQMITCGCPRAPLEAAGTATEARRAAAAQEFQEMEIAVEAAIGRFQRTLLALDDDLCR